MRQFNEQQIHYAKQSRLVGKALEAMGLPHTFSFELNVFTVMNAIESNPEATKAFLETIATLARCELIERDHRWHIATKWDREEDVLLAYDAFERQFVLGATNRWWT